MIAESYVRHAQKVWNNAIESPAGPRVENEQTEKLTNWFFAPSISEDSSAVRRSKKREEQSK